MQGLCGRHGGAARRPAQRAPCAAPSRSAVRQRAQPARRHTAAVHATAVWRQLEQTGAWVVHTRAARRPRAVVHFLGGAFAGAAPQVAYHLLLELLAEAGFTCIATPYLLTFKHLDCARDTAASFRAAVGELRAGGRGYLAPPGSAVVGVGHSNGALLHLLIGALLPGHAAANVLVSFNNKQVSDAIPIPGLLDGLRPTVGDGVTEFTPPPAESRALIASAYAVRRSLLVRFEEDSIDETPEMVELLRGGAGPGGAAGLLLPGSHITPCGSDLDVGGLPPLAAAVAGSQADVRRLAAEVAAWIGAALEGDRRDAAAGGSAAAAAAAAAAAVAAVAEPAVAAVAEQLAE
ncbi:MAG: hypothetical protein J3K34DRAFT_388971 [Monoraphidium minutum]|nr:MAG: hypothetical protein J3K34DRAFT_388971 [Monoraphidium minutum]